MKNRKTLPSQGTLPKGHYGTGHFSQDYYTSMIAGQPASQDLQSDCDKVNKDLGTNANIVSHTGTRVGAGDARNRHSTGVFVPIGP